MTQKPESRLQRRIRERLCQEFPGCYVRKIHGNQFQHAGIPDLICCIKGRFVGIEVKESFGHTTDLQLNERNEIKDAQGLYFTMMSPDDVVKLKAIL